MASERNTLPGSPSNSLVRDVRRILRLYVASQPKRDDKNWKEAWAWANRCRYERMVYSFEPLKRAKNWPLPSEIASTFLLLALAEMRDSRMLRLPYLAERCAPEGFLVNNEQVKRIEHVKVQ